MDELNKVLKDFLNDVTTTFPEIKDTLHDNLNKVLNDESDDESNQFLLEYFQTVFRNVSLIFCIKRVRFLKMIQLTRNFYQE